MNVYFYGLLFCWCFNAAWWWSIMVVVVRIMVWFIGCSSSSDPENVLFGFRWERGHGERLVCIELKFVDHVEDCADHVEDGAATKNQAKPQQAEKT